MNYEKRYNEMLAKARAFYKKWDGVDAYNSSLAISELKEIFPELNESEGEKVKETLINYLKERKSCESYGQYVLRYDHWITWLEKQGEPKSADKVGSKKFKVGQWYQCTKDFFTFDKNTAYYCAKEGCLQDEYGCHIAIVKDLYDNFKLWTIENAKDGDVLCTYECGVPKIVFVLKGTPKEHYVLSYYCYYNIMYPYFEPDSKTGCLAPNEEDVKPATEEQRHLLFQKMKESGYEWMLTKRNQ